MTNIVKIYAQGWLRDKMIYDLNTQKLIIEFANEIDKMLEESLVGQKGSDEKN